MIDQIAELTGGLFLVLGSIVLLTGGIGLIRLPDFFCRLHSVGVIDTLGAGLVLFGLLILSGSVVVFFKIAMIGVLIFILSPVASHALANTAIRAGIEGESALKSRTDDDEA